jgi:hypothetical protein
MTRARQFANCLDAVAPSFPARINAATERMIATQMTAYPADWSDADKREMAERHLFGVRS